MRNQLHGNPHIFIEWRLLYHREFAKGRVGVTSECN
jgi:hypothetical protein